MGLGCEQRSGPHSLSPPARDERAAGALPSLPVSTPPAVLFDAPILAQVVRGDLVESVHRASVCVAEPGGRPDLVLGDATSPCFPRSSNKPLQALAMVRAGLDLPDHLLALTCASHSGQDYHLAGVREILDGAGLGLADLQNTPDLPYDPAAREAALADGAARSSLFQNCSGKHAAMLATCRVAGWDLASYRDPGHPLQRHIAEVVGELAGESITASAVDGCGAPVVAISLGGLARAFGALAAADEATPEGRVARAMRRHPEYVGGDGRDVTILMSQTPGLIAKDGAEAVYAVGLADGRGVALKVADGGQRARPVILAAVLRRIGVHSPALAALEDAPVLGHGEPVGAVVATGI